MNGNTTQGSYGFAIKSLAEGLAVAQSAGWVSGEEARDEFRANVKTIQELEQRKDHVDRLRRRADDIEAFGAADPDTVDQGPF